MKSGFKTTEFWVTVLCLAGTYTLVALGKVASVQDAIALTGPFLGAVGYSLARAKSKNGGGS
jgi:hypothetical protein